VGQKSRGIAPLPSGPSASLASSSTDSRKRRRLAREVMVSSSGQPTSFPCELQWDKWSIEPLRIAERFHNLCRATRSAFRTIRRNGEFASFSFLASLAPKEIHVFSMVSPGWVGGIRSRALSRYSHPDDQNLDNPGARAFLERNEFLRKRQNFFSLVPASPYTSSIAPMQPHFMDLGSLLGTFLGSLLDSRNRFLGSHPIPALRIQNPMNRAQLLALFRSTSLR